MREFKTASCRGSGCKLAWLIVVALSTWLLRASWIVWPDLVQAAATTPEKSLRHIEELEAAWLCCVICQTSKVEV